MFSKLCSRKAWLSATNTQASTVQPRLSSPQASLQRQVTGTHHCYRHVPGFSSWNSDLVLN